MTRPARARLTHPTEPTEPTNLTELTDPLDPIRVETVLSRLPIHRLARDAPAIDLVEVAEAGHWARRWSVSHNSKYGPPGALAYKLDTLVVNRRIEAAGRPTPEILRLGSLKEIARELGLGGDTGKVKRALLQNAGAFIETAITYRGADGRSRTFEISDNRYGVVLTGERLPDGRVSDAVHLILDRSYREVLDRAPIRPLDYGYLLALPPVAQRWYELASFKFFAALTNGRQTARMSYADFSARCPQRRYDEREQARKQMYKVHRVHIDSGYIAAAALEPAPARDGRPDWWLVYTPGPRAEAEFRTFAKGLPAPDSLVEGGPVVSVSTDDDTSTPLPPPDPGPTKLVGELAERGVTRGVAEELVRAFPEDRIRAQIDAVDRMRAERPAKLKAPAAYLVQAIREDFALPVGPVAVAGRLPAAEAEDRAERVRRRAEDDRVRAHWERLTPAERDEVDRAALAAAAAELRNALDREAVPAMRRLRLKSIRDAYIRAQLGLPPAG